MNRAWPALAVAVLCGVAWGQAPAYSAAGIVNASDFSPGPFAPNSVLSLFGANLAWPGSQQTDLTVYVDNQPAPVLFVSPAQINFLVPSNETPHDATVRVVRQGVSGPAVAITLVNAAPALFVMANGDAIAQNATYQYQMVTSATPAHAGDCVVLYATGLGVTQPNPTPGEIPATAASITNPSALQIQLAGVAIDPTLIKYAGLTPGFEGLYQINFIVPSDVLQDAAVRVVLGGQASAAGPKLPVSQ